MKDGDSSKRAADAPPRMAGIGMLSIFVCARCNQNKGLMGRKLQPVRGAKQWVCKGCVK